MTETIRKLFPSAKILSPSEIMQIILKLYLCVLILFGLILKYSPLPASADDSLEVDHSVVPKTIEKGKNLLIDFNITNNADKTAVNLTLDIVSTGFKVISNNQLPNQIYPDSIARGQYVLEPISLGTHPIYLDWIYSASSATNSSLPMLQVFNVSKIGQVEVIKPSFELDLATIWPGTFSTIIGIIAGAAVTRYGELFKQKDTERKERRSNINKVRSLLLRDLIIFEKILRNKYDLDESNFINWIMLTTQGLYHYLAENQKLEELVVNFYTDLREIFNLKQEAEKLVDPATKLQEIDVIRRRLLSKVNSIRELISKWKE